MKYLLAFLLLTDCVYAQVSPKVHLRRYSPYGLTQRDSMPEVFPPDIISPARMPIAHPSVSLYRNHNDPANVMRSTLDNMPIKGPDSSVHYSILRSYQKLLKPKDPPFRFRQPMPGK